MLDRLKPLLEFCQGLDLSDPPAAKTALEAQFPIDGELIQGIAAAMRAGVADGSLCNQGEAPMQYSRILKPRENEQGFSADAVLMNGAGPRHRHPLGEIDLCFAVDGEPTFDGQAPGWTIYGPDSVHVPTVKNGTMLILYLLPQGQLEFLKA
jgi:uncharacterized protein DUF4863